MKKQFAKLKITFFIFLLLALGFFTANYLKLFNNNIKSALAEDGENESEHEDGQKSSSSSSKKVEYKTVYVKLPDQIVTTTKEIPRHDSDGDGLYDDEDPHPTINEFLIVKDDNLDGIDDKYEQP